MIAITYEIHVLEPLIATQSGGDPNSAISYPYVPGSVIRGALATRFLPHPDFDLAGDTHSRRLFFDGTTRYLNAYPLDRLGQRTLPVPLAWFYEKRDPLVDGTPLYDWSVESANYLEQPQRLKHEFCRLGDGDVEFSYPQFQINVHTAREREKGRATEEEGAVFRYQAIAEGERLGGVILASTAEDAATMRALLTKGELWLGGSRSGGYGRVCIANIREHSDWHETGSTCRTVEAGEPVAVTLLSDMILRSPDGAYMDYLLPEFLPEPLNRTLTPSDPVAFKQIVRIGGFNRKWGLPFYQVPALQAGSVFVFTAQENLDVASLRTLEHRGIGERRVEGFGRVAVNWHTMEPVLTVRVVEPELPMVEDINLSSASAKLANKMVERLLRRDLDRRLVACVRRRDLGNRPWPNKAQLSRLRAVTLNALPDSNVARVSRFLSDDLLKLRARGQYETARIDNVPLLKWLRERVKAPKTIWRLLSSGKIRLPEIGDVQAQLRDDLAREYTLRLITGVLQRAAKELGDE